MAFVNLSNLAPSNGWLIAAALVFATMAWVLVMLREIRDAVDLPDPYSDDVPNDHERFQLERAEPSLGGSGERWVPVQKPVRQRPRKARSVGAKS